MYSQTMCVKLIKRWEYGYNTRCRPESRVSAASVSRVLKNDTTFSVSQKTRERILEAAGELGYNKCFEYSAIQGTRGTIGVMLLYGEEEEVEDKFYQIIRVNIKMELEKKRVQSKRGL